MTKRQSKPSEFEAMEQVFEILKLFDGPARTRIVEAVDDKIIAEAPKPRVRKKSQPLQAAPVLSVATQKALYEAAAQKARDKIEPDVISQKLGSPN